jgi:hypothetical protein
MGQLSTGWALHAHGAHRITANHFGELTREVFGNKKAAHREYL